MSSVTIIDYGNGNANSIKEAFSLLGVRAVFSRTRDAIASASHLVLPGVGHHGAAMHSLRDGGLVETLERSVLSKRTPVLGICLGMQLMTKSSEEGGEQGLGWIDAATTKLQPKNTRQFKVPHVGWNTVFDPDASMLLRGIDVETEPFYFCHSYEVTQLKSAAIATVFTYDTKHIASFESENIFGVQFHPEKSQEPGLRLLQNFLKSQEV